MRKKLTFGAETREEIEPLASARRLSPPLKRTGTPLSLSKHLSELAVVAESLNITWKLHIPYHPQSSGKVEKANGFLKAQLTKLTLETRLSWPTLLPLALTRLRATPRGPSGLSPFELLYGRPFLISHNLPAVPPPLLSYLPYLTLLRALLRAHADAVIPAPNDHDHKEAPFQGLFPGDQVLLRNLHPGSLQTRWTGPHTVILTTPTAAKLLGHQAWVHINKRATAGNDWTSQMVGPTKLRLYGLLPLVLLSPLTQATECECMRGSGRTRYFQSFTYMPSKCYAVKSPYTCTSVHAPGRPSGCLTSLKGTGTVTLATLTPRWGRSAGHIWPR
ncbi:uncharacterized protein LOC121104791 [Ursus maritimus]|uniref:Uncharacterized protein LOC121104791 n=1 Tax=Ursus maritimus TaxID=29073 RepID=A0A8M1GK01_URSMA|nr:uncharacterized protein LOC121104791 [Ursus maritimus]